MKPFEPELLPLSSLDWASHIPALGRANRALAKYDGVLYGVPNPAVLLSPLITQEAVLSSKIEGTQASFNDVLFFEAGEKVEDANKAIDIREIQNYRQALRQAETTLEKKPFHLNLLLEMHATLLDSVRGRDKGMGRTRGVQNWIGPEGCPIEQASFVPPAPTEIDKLLDNWEKYYHQEERDPLAQLAIVHAQFEIIHPFLDGNGRLGRILVPLFLHEKKVLSRPVFYLSEYLESRRDEYVRRLRELGSPGSWDNWIQFFLGALEAQAEKNCAKASKILDLYEDLKKRIMNGIARSAYAVPLLDFMFENPVFNSTRMSRDDRSPSGPMVSSFLKKLIKNDILVSIREPSGSRPGVYALRSLVNLCEGQDIL